MLIKINIANYALIDSMSVDFSAGMTTITGETGAGKSIILGALGLTLGERVDTSVLRNTDEKCIIESIFNIEKLDLEAFFTENELDFEVETILRREITAQGKSRAFVNDTPVSLNVLKSLSEKLIDVHSQHQTLNLNAQQYQLDILDVLAHNQDLRIQYTQELKAYKESKNKLENLLSEEEKLKKDAELYLFQLKELESIPLASIVEEELVQELDTLSNAEDIKVILQAVEHLIENEQGILSHLHETDQLLGRHSDKNTGIKRLYDRLVSTKIEIKDISREIQQLNDSISLDPQRLEEISGTYQTLKGLYKKYAVTNLADLLSLKESIEEKVQLSQSFDAEITKLQNQVNEKEQKLRGTAIKLSKSRKGVVDNFAKEIHALLKDLSMPNALLSVDFTYTDTFKKDGVDLVQFNFSSNKGLTPQPIAKVASGGELSRLMLCIKKIVSQHKALPTIIFDEIDTGVSGEVASKMGEVMRNISKSTQVFAITHLPQIASKGQQHLFVYKEDSKDQTYTRIKQLDKASRVEELAKMLSGESITEAALQNAKALLAI